MARTEGECLKLLRQANLSEDTLQEILSDRSARKFHAVRMALAAHPRTPRTDALALVATLFWRDLAHLSANSRVHPSIRRAADQDLLRRLPEMAVAERIDLARNVGRGTLLQLRLDADARVMASVLENRFTTEPDVILAAARAREPAVLELIAAHPRGSRAPPSAARCCGTQPCPGRSRSGCSAARASRISAGSGTRRGRATSCARARKESLRTDWPGSRIKDHQSPGESEHG